MKQVPTSDLREQTVRYWAGFVHARGAIDVARVHAFQAMLRDRDLTTLTDDEVSAAYGGPGWAPSPSCWECGGREGANVTFGQQASSGELFALCPGCVDAARAMTTPAAVNSAPAPKRSFFSRLKEG